MVGPRGHLRGGSGRALLLGRLGHGWLLAGRGHDRRGYPAVTASHGILRPSRPDTLPDMGILGRQGRAAGYTGPRHPQERICGFVRNPDLPMLVIETFPAGKVIPHHGMVPPGQTGVVVSLT